MVAGEISVAPTPSKGRSIWAILVFVCFTVAYFLFTAYKVKEGDGVEYAFMVPESVETNPYKYVENLSDIWQSQCIHYQVVNGRFLLHFVVQIYCGLLPHTLFALSNALMYLLMALLLAKLAKIDVRDLRNALVVNCLAFLSICHTSFDSSHQVGYLWSTVGMLCMLLMYRDFKSDNWLKISAASVAAFLLGSLHEAFAIPVGSLLVIDFISRKGRVGRQRLCMAVAFGIGALVTIFAPGNFLRISGFERCQLFMAPYHLAYNLVMGWVLLILLLIRRWDKRIPLSQRKLRTFVRKEWKLLTAAVLAMVTFSIAGVVYRQALQGVNFIFLLLIFKLIADYPLRKLWLGALMVITACVLYVLVCELLICNRKYTEVQRQYYGGTDGIVELPQPLYGFEFRRAEVLCIPYTWVARVKNPSAPDLHIYPEGLKSVPADCDTTFLRDLGDQGWLMVNSKQHPRTFILSKYIFGVKVNEHPVDLSPQALGFVAESEMWTAVAYVNEHKLLFTTNIELKD